MKIIINEQQLNLFIHKIITESTTVPFTLNKNEKGLYTYTFTVDDKIMVAEIYPNPWNKNYYDAVFGEKGGKTTDRIGKDLSFMNTVLYTIANCMIDFINDKKNVRIIAFQAEPLRERAYLRFFTNHPYFSKFEITKSGIWNEININKSEFNENTNTKLKNLIKESVSDVVYHYTRIYNLVNILKTNKINLSPSYGIGADQSLNYNKLYSLSLTTARNSATGYHSTGKNEKNAKGKIRLEMNGRELNYNYKSKHVDYWQYPRTKEITQMSGSYDEMEERIITDKNQISPANRYISAIEIYVDERQFKTYHEIEQLAKNLNIPCYFYDNGKDFNFSIKKNAIKLPDTYDETDEYNPNYTEEELEHRTLIYIKRIAGIISYKDDNIKNKILKYAQENGFNVKKVNKLIDEDINSINYNYLAYPQDYLMRELELVISSEIGNSRSISDEFVRYVIKLLGYDMKTRNIKTIKDYIWYKAYIGKKTQKQFNEQFYKKILTVIDSKYNEYLNDLNNRSFVDISGEYYGDNVIKMVPEIKTNLDNIINEIKKYYKEKILSNDDMFKYTFYFAHSEIKTQLNLENRDYQFAKDVIDYNESNLNEYNIKNVINYMLYEVSDFAALEIKKMQEEYSAQHNR